MPVRREWQAPTQRRCDRAAPECVVQRSLVPRNPNRSEAMADQIKWVNPNTGEMLIHREGGDRRELLFDIYGPEGDEHSHLVIEGGRVRYVRDKSSMTITDDRMSE